MNRKRDLMNNSYDIDKVNNFDGFAKDIGIVITRAENGEADGCIELKKRHFNPIGSVHGGCLFSLADTVGGVALASSGVTCTTLSSNIEYLKGAMEGVSHKLTAEGRPLRIGRKIAVYEVTIRDEHNTLICKATVDFFVMSEKHKFKYNNESVQ